MRNTIINWACAVLLVAVFRFIPPNGYRGYFIFPKPDVTIKPATDSVGYGLVEPVALETYLLELESRAFWERLMLPQLGKHLQQALSSSHHGVHFRIVKIEHDGRWAFAIEVVLERGGELLFDSIHQCYREAVLSYHWNRGPRAVVDLKVLKSQAEATLMALETTPETHPNFDQERDWLRERIATLDFQINLARNRPEAPLDLPFEPYKPDRQWCFWCR